MAIRLEVTESILFKGYEGSLLCNCSLLISDRGKGVKVTAKLNISLK